MKEQKEITSKRIPKAEYLDILYGGSWDGFENNFEEGWGGEPDVYSLANHDHHLEVAALAAYKLSAIYEDQDELYQVDCWEDITQAAYNKAAKELYPNEKLWPGTAENDPEFWREHLRGARQDEIDQLWNPEWGPFDRDKLVRPTENFWEAINTLKLLPEHTRGEINSHYTEEEKEWVAELVYDLCVEKGMPGFKLISYNRIDHPDDTGVHIFGFNLNTKTHITELDAIDISTAINRVFGDEIPVEVNIVSGSRVYVLWYYEV